MGKPYCKKLSLEGGGGGGTCRPSEYDFQAFWQGTGYIKNVKFSTFSFGQGIKILPNAVQEQCPNIMESTPPGLQVG